MVTPQRRGFSEKDVERLRVLKDRVADELGADRFAHKRARPVASDEVVAFDRRVRAGIEVDRAGRYAVLALSQVGDLCPALSR
jgi:hypothetical protein